MLNTETPNANHADLDLYPVEKLTRAFIDDQLEAVAAVQKASDQIAAAVTAAVTRLEAGGRLVYVGAGTSGRLGLLDSVELHPTFQWPRERAIALLAGGDRAVLEAIEGAEDSREQGAQDIKNAKTGPNDIVIALAASGSTPYVRGALEAAKAAGALTIGIANNPGAPVVTESEIGITLDTGSEIISGSTRLKAGTSQKIALNTFSSAVMVRLNKVYGNLMVDVKATNAKLIRRTVTLTMLATKCTEEVARNTLESCQYQVKTAIVAIACKLDVDAARARLESSNGSVRRAIS